MIRKKNRSDEEQDNRAALWVLVGVLSFVVCYALVIGLFLRLTVPEVKRPSRQSEKQIRGLGK